MPVHQAACPGATWRSFAVDGSPLLPRAQRTFARLAHAEPRRGEHGRADRPPAGGSDRTCRLRDGGPAGHHIVNDDDRPQRKPGAPARFWARCWCERPTWSVTARRWSSAGRTFAICPRARSSVAATRAMRRIGSWPRRRTDEPDEGAGTSQNDSASSAAARTARARWRPRGRARSSRPRSFWAMMMSGTGSR
jgi:hypothetical protein